MKGSTKQGEGTETPNQKIEEKQVIYRVELEQEADKRWLAEVMNMPGVMAYGKTPAEAASEALELAEQIKKERTK